MDDIYKDLEEYNPNLCKNCSQKSYSYLIIDATLASENTSRFRRIFYKKNI